MVHDDRSDDGYPETWEIDEPYHTALRYGENPHQEGAAYIDETVDEASIIHAPQLNDTASALSYVNHLDADGGLQLIREFDDPAAAVIKHTNPAGCAVSSTLNDAYKRAHATDSMSAYGGIVALNRECDAETAESIVNSPPKRIVVAPSYSEDALQRLRQQETLRILAVGDLSTSNELVQEKSLVGGRLVQERDQKPVTRSDLECVTSHEPSEDHLTSMLFAWKVVKHVVSNATVLAIGSETVGIGAGQPSRIDSVLIAKRKAADHAEGKNAEGAILATDGYHFPDTVEVAAEAGIEAIIQPGGSVRDEDVISTANQNDIAIIFTNQRCFKHG